MPTPWLRVILATNMVSRPERMEPAVDERAAAAVAMSGGAIDYRNLRDVHPSLPEASDDDWRASADRALLAGLLHQISGIAGAEERFRHAVDVASDDDTRAAAAILCSIALVEDDRPDDAIDCLVDARGRVGQGAHLERAALGLHSGLRHGEAGRWQAAVADTESASALLAERDDDLALLLARVSRDNLANYRMRAGGEISFAGPADPLPSTLRWSLSERAEIAELLLDLRFRDRLVDARAIGGFSSTAAVIDDGLWRLWFQAERLALWGATRRSRRGLGRYRLAQAAARGAEEGVAEALLLLVDGGDAEVSRATRWAMRHHSAAEAAAFGRRVVDTRWSTSRRQEVLGVLGAAGQLLDAPRADRSVDQLLGIIRDPQPVASQYTAMRALPGVLPAASDAMHDRVASAVVDLLTDTRGDDSVLRVDDIVRTLRWKAIDRPTTAQARTLVERWAAGGASVGAAALLLPLARLGPAWGRRTALAAFEREPTLLHAALVLDAGGRVAPATLDAILAVASAELEAERDRAAGGRHTMVAINGALVLAVGASRAGAERAATWGVLAGYLTDARVMAGPKLVVLDALATLVPRLGEGASQVIRGAVRAGIEGVWLHDDELVAFRGRVFRLGLALGGLDATAIRERLVDLLAAPVPSTRVEAARSLPLARQRLGADASLLAVSQLLADPDAEVRAEAGASAVIMLRGHGFGRNADPGVVERLLEALREPGLAVPAAVLGELRWSRLVAKLEPLAVGVEQVQVTTPSAVVRGIAKAVVDRWSR